MNHVILLALLVATLCYAAPRLPRPKIYGNAIPYKDLDTSNEGTKKKIVLMHNFFRSRVQPPANDMLAMSWHDGAAEDAQRWAQSCQLLLHDNTTGRWTQDFGTCGQNIFVANVQVPWFFAAKIWFLEKDNFTYGKNLNDPDVVGHYTQMVWYSTHKVGCGFHYCGPDVVKIPYYSYVCNYCPIGNHPDRFDRPYTKGKPCSACPGQCKFKKLCTNTCPHADTWINCRELNETWHDWLCGNEQNEGHQACRATCACEGAIR
uniref:U41-Theraphotoxin-Ct1b_1 n=1 Tax=Coremiocnemis tropix TaxID=1904443 RepID=A0A482Z676_CORTR